MTEPLYLKDVSQVPSELAALIAILQRERVTRFLEVGSRYGGSLWRIARALPKGSLIVSVDSGKGMGGNKDGQLESLRACIHELCVLGYDTHLIEADSQLQDTVQSVASFAPFDAAFIDADHELKGVRRDWLNYRKFAPIIAFHDVGWVKPANYQNSKVVEVPQLWNELRDLYRSETFIDHSTGRTMGIGVLWHREHPL